MSRCYSNQSKAVQGDAGTTTSSEATSGGRDLEQSERCNVMMVMMMMRRAMIVIPLPSLGGWRSLGMVALLNRVRMIVYILHDVVCCHAVVCTVAVAGSAWKP